MEQAMQGLLGKRMSLKTGKANNNQGHSNVHYIHIETVISVSAKYLNKCIP